MNRVAGLAIMEAMHYEDEYGQRLVREAPYDNRADILQRAIELLSSITVSDDGLHLGAARQAEREVIGSTVMAVLRNFASDDTVYQACWAVRGLSRHDAEPSPDDISEARYLIETALLERGFIKPPRRDQAQRLASFRARCRELPEDASMRAAFDARDAELDALAATLPPSYL